MPLVTVKVFERRLDPDSEARIIKAMTDALLEALEAEELRDHTWVLVEGYDPHRWGRPHVPAVPFDLCACSARSGLGGLHASRQICIAGAPAAFGRSVIQNDRARAKVDAPSAY